MLSTLPPPCKTDWQWQHSAINTPTTLQNRLTMTAQCYQHSHHPAKQTGDNSTALSVLPPPCKTDWQWQHSAINTPTTLKNRLAITAQPYQHSHHPAKQTGDDSTVLSTLQSILSPFTCSTQYCHVTVSSVQPGEWAPQGEVSPGIGLMTYELVYKLWIKAKPQA